ncbi:phosphatase PAP2 family protein [Sphingomonas sp. BT-65]|uniref:phosphatase PAP2 family protein n=1 Tax=Sphingomonas sp. BT-65 TaxID=2989821 RepID=UPI002236970F|nr:phosphatase PAP2 family protein [Sphingomonas sp. BT-65]MCW4461663.1 phosphatase PAP2 family protein [Sphingomonas sp. BT-65]
MSGSGIAIGQRRLAILGERSGRPALDANAFPAYRLLGLQTMLVVLLLAALGFTYRGEDINLMIAVLAAMAGIAALLRWRDSPRLAAAIEGCAILVAASMAVACLSLLLATLGYPYRDTALQAADELLLPFLSWPDLARSLAGQAELTAAMCRVYSTLLWQPFALVATLAALGKVELLWRFLHAWALALIACVAIFALVPAETAYVHYGFVPADLPYLTVNAGWWPAEILEKVRTGQLRELGAAQISGLITFPSFHTAAAVLLAWGFRRVPFAGPFFVLLNVAMIATVPLIGSHYFVDVLGGIAVALLAIAGSRTSLGH